MNSPNIIPDCCTREFRPIRSACVRIDCYGRSRPIRGTHDVCAKDEESAWVERFSSTHEGSPPKVHILNEFLISEEESETYQSSTSALPVKAWQMLIALSAAAVSLPHVLYATGTFCRVLPDSRVKDGATNICCSRREENEEDMTAALWLKFAGRREKGVGVLLVFSAYSNGVCNEHATWQGDDSIIFTT